MDQNKKINNLINQYGGKSIPFSKLIGIFNKKPKKTKKKRKLKKSLQPSRSPRKLRDGVRLKGKDKKMWKTLNHKWVRVK
jgi:hypothetical protein